MKRIAIKAHFCTEDGEVLVSETIECEIPDDGKGEVMDAARVLDTANEAASHALDALKIVIARTTGV